MTDDEIVDELLSIPSFGPLLIASMGTPESETRIIVALGRRVKRLEAELRQRAAENPIRHRWWQRRKVTPC